MGFIYFMVFVFGSCIGSFSNVCIFRWLKNESVINVPSHCYSCKKTIKWYDNIPIISYLLLKGKCRYCHENISLQYPIIEFITGGVYLSIFYVYNFSWMSVLLMFVSWLFIVATVTDILNREIPNELIIVGIGGIIINAVFGEITILQIIIGLFFPSVLLLLIAIIYEKISGIETAVGGGDIKFLFIIGGLMGAKFSITILLLGSILLMLIYFCFFIEDIIYNKKSYIPMMIGFALAYIYILLIIYLNKFSFSIINYPNIF